MNDKCKICEGTGKRIESLGYDENGEPEGKDILIPCACRNEEHLINEIADKINDILEFRGISDNGKNFNEDVKEYILPIIKIYIKNL